MSKDEIRILTLPPMRVASVNGFGSSPEGIAFEKMTAWAREHALLGKPYRTFGFNNPDPTPGSPNYGYDVWITVDESVPGDDGTLILDFSGGLYAVSRVEVQAPGDDIPRAWQALVRWLEGSRYHHGTHQWLEEHLGPLEAMGGDQPFVLDLHLPIRE